jgi:hypothetical protein
MGGFLGGIASLAGGLVGGIINSNQTSRAVGAAVDWNRQAADKIAGTTSDAQAGMKQAVGQGNAEMFNTTAQGNDALTGSYDAQKANLDPYLQAGQQGIGSIADMMKPGGELTKQFDFNPTDLQNDPGYQFQLQQGNKAVTNAGAAGGSAGSGNTMKAMSQYNQGLAGTTYTNAYNRALTTFQTNRDNLLKPLEFMSGAGQTASGQFNSASQNYGNQTSKNYTDYGKNASENDVYGANYVGNAGMAGGKAVADIFQNIGNIKAQGSLKQGSIWSNFANSAAGTIGGMKMPSFGGGGIAGGEETTGNSAP